MSRLFISDDQNTGASASASVLQMSIQDRVPLRLTGLVSLLSKGLSGVFYSTTVQRHQFFDFLPSLWSSCHHSLDYMKLCWQSNVSVFQHTIYICHSFPAKKQSSDFIVYISFQCLQSLSTVMLEPKKKKSATTSTFSPSICNEVMGPNATFCFFLFVLFVCFLFLVLSWLFHSLPSPSSRSSLVPLPFLPLERYHPHI